MKINREMINRRSQNNIFVKDDILMRADEKRLIGLWKFMQLFFPEDTNKKQFDCAFKFMKELLERKQIESTNLKEIVGEEYYVNLTTIVLPKLERFGLVGIEGDRGKGKTYSIRLEKIFSDRIRYIGLEWFRIYAKHGGDSYGG